MNAGDVLAAHQVGATAFCTGCDWRPEGGRSEAVLIDPAHVATVLEAGPIAEAVDAEWGKIVDVLSDHANQVHEAERRGAQRVLAAVEAVASGWPLSDPNPSECRRGVTQATNALILAAARAAAEGAS